MLEYMIQHCWQAASRSEGASRGPVQLAGPRQTHLTAMKNSFSPAAIIKQANMVEQAATFRPMPTGLGVAKDWNLHKALERVNAYAFRSDKRPPTLVKADRGFNPPCTRTDNFYVAEYIFPRFKSHMQEKYGVGATQETFDRVCARAAAAPEERKVLNHFLVWTKLHENEQFHLGRMKVNEFMKGYISTTRATAIAKSFADADGWVYVKRGRGGFVMPEQCKHVWTKGANRPVARPVRPGRCPGLPYPAPPGLKKPQAPARA